MSVCYALDKGDMEVNGWYEVREFGSFCTFRDREVLRSGPRTHSPRSCHQQYVEVQQMDVSYLITRWIA